MSDYVWAQGYTQQALSKLKTLHVKIRILVLMLSELRSYDFDF